MPAIAKQQLIEQLNWRYAVKRFDPSRKISATDWHTLEQTLVLAPSSYGLQPWKFFVIDNSELRAALLPASWGQSQITEASHLLVFAVNNRLAAEDVDRYLRRIADVRGVPVESLAGMRKMVLGSVNRKPEEVQTWSTRQAYIALGGFLTAAALLGIDACPMEGFEPAKYDQILGLDKLGYGSVVLATAGYRAADDKYAQLAKVRFEHGDVVQHL